MRTLSPEAQALKARIEAGERAELVPLLYLGLPVPQRWALGGAPLPWGGHTWVAQDLSLQQVVDDLASPGGLRVDLPGVTPAQVALGVDDTVEGSEVICYLAWVDTANGTVADAIQVWSGELDVPGWEDGPTAVVHFTAEHRAALAYRPRPVRYTNDDQQRLYPGDTSLNIDPATDSGPLVWPGASYGRVPE